MQANTPLVKILEELYESTIEHATPLQAREGLPEGLNFKLALLGKGYSGKKTLAK